MPLCRRILRRVSSPARPSHPHMRTLAASTGRSPRVALLFTTLVASMLKRGSRGRRDVVAPFVALPPAKLGSAAARSPTFVAMAMAVCAVRDEPGRGRSAAESGCVPCTPYRVHPPCLLKRRWASLPRSRHRPASASARGCMALPGNMAGTLDVCPWRWTSRQVRADT